MDANQVEKLIFNLDKIKVNLIKAKVRTPQAIAEWLENTAVPYCKKQAVETQGEYRKVMTSLYNSAQSLLEGIRSGDASLDDAIDIGREFKVGSAQIESLWAAEEAKKAKSTQTDVSQDGFLNGVSNDDPIIKKYSIYANDMPRTLKRDIFTIKRFPIIPLAEPPFNFQKLKAAKLADDHISYYPILKNQPVIGLNYYWVQDEFRGKSDRALEYVLDTLKIKSNQTYHRVGLPVHLHAGKASIVWYWTPSEKDLNRLMAASSSGRVNVEKWGFAFNV